MRVPTIGGYGIIGQRALAIPLVGTGVIVRREFKAIVIRGSAADVLPHETHRTCGWVFGRVRMLICRMTGKNRRRLNRENGRDSDRTRERIAGRLRLGHVQLHLLITSPADEPDFDNTGGTMPLNRFSYVDLPAFPKSSASSSYPNRLPYCRSPR